MDTENSLKGLQQLRIQPDNIDFGCLKPGETGNVLVKVSGGPAKVLVNNDQVKVEPSSFDGEGELKVLLSPSAAGNLIWDNIVLKRDEIEIKVLVTARWEVPAFQVNIGEALAMAASKTTELPTPDSLERTYRGKACAWCGRNFGYNADSQSWEQCHCNWYQKGINGGSRVVKELRYGIKDFPSFAKETWNIILGKQKW